MKAIILHQSIRGKTERFALNIASFLESKGIQVTTKSILHYSEKDIQNSDFVLLGCWTNGLMIALQHPDKEWVAWSRALPDLTNKKVGFFTTYLFATGSMFKKMKKHISCNQEEIVEIKSKNGKLSEVGVNSLESFLKVS